MRYSLLVPLMLVGAVTPAPAQLSIGINIGLNVSSYPDLEPIPGYPAYYAPGMNSNYFFYDGMYWVYQGDTWYSSEWYNGPWSPVDSFGVPLFVLRIPVRYYRQPPAMFMGWQGDAAPHWGEHYGRDWEHRRSGWDRWDRRSVPAPARLPVYQRNYSGDRYPRVDQQRALNTRNYQYKPRDPVVRQQVQQHRAQAQAAPQGRPEQHGDQGRGNQHPTPAPQNHERPIPTQQPAPRPIPTQQHPAPAPRPQERPAPSPRPQERPSPAPRPQERPAPAPRPQERPAPAPRPQERPAPAQRPQERPAPAQRPQERQQPAQQHEQPKHDQGHGKGEERHEERK